MGTAYIAAKQRSGLEMAEPIILSDRGMPQGDRWLLHPVMEMSGDQPFLLIAAPSGRPTRRIEAVKRSGQRRAANRQGRAS
jgi:hypothetical protein